MPDQKKRIALASLLKPVNDTRMTGKIASALCSHPQAEVHIIGYPSASKPVAGVTYHSFAPFARLSLQRLATLARIFSIIKSIRPHVLIITTHELLFIAFLAKMLFRSKVIYDVQENYYLNILYTNAFPPLLRFPIAGYVRLKEWITCWYVDRYLLAEDVYAQQLKFVKGKFTMVRNKVAEKLRPRDTIDNPFALIFSGTLSQSTGVFEAIALATELYKLEQRITLTLIGHAAQKEFLKDLETEIKNKAFIKLIGGKEHVDHDHVISALESAGAGIISYNNNPATAGRMPTKLYEYSALQLPVVIYAKHPDWEKFALQYTKTIAITDATFDAERVLQWLKSSRKLLPLSPDVYFKSEEIALKSAIIQL
jgi:hypothetical protein